MVEVIPEPPSRGKAAGIRGVRAMILVAIGANLAAPDGWTPYQLCNEAVEALSRLPDLVLTGVSRWYRSAPVPPSDQPDYVNGVARLDARNDQPGPDPAALLAALQRIEQAAGRRRGAANAARTLDLDIIAMGPAGSLVRDRPDPVLPHPRAHERAFVLLPLREVAPGWVHPGTGRNVGQLVAALPAQDIGQPAIRVIASGPSGPSG